MKKDIKEKKKTIMKSIVKKSAISTRKTNDTKINSAELFKLTYNNYVVNTPELKNVSFKTCQSVCQLLLKTIYDSIIDGSQVYLPQLVSFSTKLTQPRQFISITERHAAKGNDNKPESVPKAQLAPAKIKIVVKISKKFAETVNNSLLNKKKNENSKNTK